jgi:ferredoxin
MAVKVVRKDELKKLIKAVEKKSTFVGPVLRKGDVTLAIAGPDDELALSYSNFKLPLKNLLFPKKELICTYDDEGMVEILPSAEEIVIFGIRPCDALSLLHLDKVFLDEEFVDPYYQERRKSAVVVVLACINPLEICYCTSVGGSPVGKEGADILAFDLQDGLLLEDCSEKGRAFMKTYADYLQKPTKADLASRNKISSEAPKKITPIDVSGLTEKLEEHFESSVWEETAQTCLGCGVCTFTCPTCHCFGLHDERYGKKGLRMRVHDSCMFTSYSLEVSGHNPRNANWERMRHRIMHKFHSTVRNFGDIFCVGCGRCIANCPVNMDIRETVAEVLHE